MVSFQGLIQMWIFVPTLLLCHDKDYYVLLVQDTLYTYFKPVSSYWFYTCKRVDSVLTVIISFKYPTDADSRSTIIASYSINPYPNKLHRHSLHQTCP